VCSETRLAISERRAGGARPRAMDVAATAGAPSAEPRRARAGDPRGPRRAWPAGKPCSKGPGSRPLDAKAAHFLPSWLGQASLSSLPKPTFRRLTALAALTVALTLAAPASAVTPRYILVSGPGLTRPVLMADWQENGSSSPRSRTSRLHRELVSATVRGTTSRCSGDGRTRNDPPIPARRTNTGGSIPHTAACVRWSIFGLADGAFRDSRYRASSRS
jgi:hypothetical protein